MTKMKTEVRKIATHHIKGANKVRKIATHHTIRDPETQLVKHGFKMSKRLARQLIAQEAEQILRILGFAIPVKLVGEPWVRTTGYDGDAAVYTLTLTFRQVSRG